MLALPRRKAEGRKPAVDIVDAVERNPHARDLLFGEFGIADAPDGVRVRIDDEPNARIRNGGELFVGQVLFLELISRYVP